MSTNSLPIVRTFMTHEMRDSDIAALATGRNDEFNRILDAIQRSRHAAPGTLQHVVLYGSRGFGKSFMTRRVQIATAGMGGERGPVHYVLLAEEQHNLQRNPHAFLDLIAEHLKQARGDTADADAAFKATMFQWPKPGEEGRRWDEAASRLEVQIDATLGGGSGLIIAVVENFDALIATLFKDGEDEQRLRHWLDRSNNRVMLFATATGTVDIHYDRPLFQAFESIRLQPWMPEDCVDYFNRLRQLDGRTELTPDETAKARAIAEFIGGTPRLAQLLAEVIDTQEALTVADTMSALADRLAEYYRRRIDDLPQLARGLLDALIRGGEPASQTALAERVGAGGQNIIARTMADLERADIIRGRRAPDSRERLYSVTDRVFVHYYRLRQGSVVARHTPLATILDFLKSFYSRDEQLLQALKHLQAGRPTEAGLFSRLAAEGLETPANEYLDGFLRRLKLYVDGTADDDRRLLVANAKLLETAPEESYHECAQAGEPSINGTALSASVRAQALCRMNLTNPAHDILDGAWKSSERDAAAIVECERYLFLRDVIGDNDAAYEDIARLGDLKLIESPTIKLAAAVIVSVQMRASGQQKEAIELLQSILAEPQPAKLHTAWMQILLELLMNFADLGRSSEALEISKRLTKLAEDTGSEGVCVASLAQAAILHGQLGQHDEAVIAARKSADLAQKVGRSRMEATSQGLLAAALGRLGQAAEAEQAGTRAVKLASQLGDPVLQVELMQQHVQTLLVLNRVEEAADEILLAVDLMDDGFPDEVRVDVLIAAGNALAQAGRQVDALLRAQEARNLAQRTNQRRAEVSALATIAASQLATEDLEPAWWAIEEALKLIRNLDDQGPLPELLVMSAALGAPLGKSDAVSNFIEAVQIMRNRPVPTDDPIWISPFFIGTAVTGDFDTLDAVLAEHGEWIVANSDTFGFSPEDGCSIARVASEKGRMAGFQTMANLLPRIEKFMTQIAPEKRDPSWLPDLISGFAENCRDSGLLRDVADLLSDLSDIGAAQTGELLRDLANVDESSNAEIVLARLNPDTSTLIRKLRGLPEPETKPTRSKRQKKSD